MTANATPAHTDGSVSPTSLAPTPLTAAAVLGLQGHRAFPTVSLLLTTTPGEGLDSQGRAAMDALARKARRRLLGVDDAATRDLVRVLDAVVAGIVGPLDRGLGLFVSTGHVARFDLPVEVSDRCVIDPTFATRDLVRALHRTPRHVVLLLAADEARLLDAPGGRMSPVTHGFPRTDPGHRRGEPARERSSVRWTSRWAPTCDCIPPRWSSRPRSPPWPRSAGSRATPPG
ncbi:MULTISPECIES: hypothetical protein [Pseudonocardia]|uniref:Uncharacterized protein n=2 Tax=Pseudonocardia TaxID=1847 RepID=A0A1Y2MGV5_PSEAH|nr:MULTISPECIES: hypothetical protein [Pseudonocardia]OSY34490.1 hypothetical protein BG845_06802 [Pseudonocardia autotrophica]OZM75486.1 hypothetical protein CFP66_46220 [Pseudonocardia sp. MH-G8]BBG01180.1 hypothetical protein Pdca_23890 [Pseudonocardia autotrophica]GEC29662.1 hypothetical protein PSA01_66910 [Pseudonocardia saturnea]